LLLASIQRPILSSQHFSLHHCSSWWNRAAPLCYCPRLRLARLTGSVWACIAVLSQLVACHYYTVSRTCCKRRTTSVAPLRYTGIQIKAPSLVYTAQYLVFSIVCYTHGVRDPILTVPGWGGSTLPTLLPGMQTDIRLVLLD